MGRNRTEIDLNTLFFCKNDVCVSDFRELMPGVPEKTVYTRIRSLVRQGKIHQIGNGRYCIGPQVANMQSITPIMLKVNTELTGSFVGMPFCLRKDNTNVFVEVPRKKMLETELFLSERHSKVVNFNRVSDILDSMEGCLIVSPMVSDSPVVECDGVYVPSIEKILVDHLSDKMLPYNDELRYFQNNFEEYTVNESTLVRYAGRRGRREQIVSLLSSLDRGRIETISKIRNYFTDKPVVRVWLFGSYARREEREDSDIDLLAVFDEGARVSLLDYSGMVLDLERITSRQIDLVEDGQLLPFAVESANRDRRLIYERKG